MKSILLAILILCSFVADAQVFTSQTLYGIQYKRGKFDSTFHLPYLSSNTVIDNLGLPAIKFATSDTSLRISTDGITYNHRIFDDRDTLPGGLLYQKFNIPNKKTIVDSGNAFGSTMIIGTTDSNGIKFIVSNHERMHLWKDGGYTYNLATEQGLIYSINSQIQIGDTVNNNMGIGKVMSGIVPFSKITTGVQNQFFGWGAMGNMTSGSFNLAMGANALSANTIGSYNISIGYNSMKVNRAGTANTVIGSLAMSSDTSGSYNSIFGYRTIPVLTIGTGNSTFGANAGDGKSNLTNCIYLGYGAGGTNGSGNIQSSIIGQMFLGVSIGVQDSTPYAFGIGYNGANNYGGGYLMYGNFSGGWLNFYGNDSVKGTFAVSKLPIYSGTGNGDSLLIAVTSSNNTFMKIAAPITATATLDFPSTVSLAQSTLTVSVTGARPGNTCAVGVPITSTSGQYTAQCFSNDVVTVIFSNTTSSVIDPASGSYTVRVMR